MPPLRPRCVKNSRLQERRYEHIYVSDHLPEGAGSPGHLNAVVVRGRIPDATVSELDE
jgi:hypothetical protein